MNTDALPPLAIYVHWPYCARICPYCDFNVYKSRADESLVSSIIADLSYWRELSGPRHIHSVHFGGGTPSLLRAGDIENILTAVDTQWGLPRGTEIALEANPDDAALQTWQNYMSAGLTRLSLGVQTFNDEGLKFLGRNHDSASGLKALKLASRVFSNISLDLIFGWKDQSLPDWQLDLDVALDHDVDHISAYQLTVEPNTAFGKASARGARLAVTDDQSADFFDATRERLMPAGYEHYEVSNYAKLNKRSQHNMAYWRGYDYVGVGPGAHGRFTQSARRVATVAALRASDYTEQVQVKGHGISEQDVLSPEHWGDEYIIMGLRLTDGVSQKRYAQITGRPLNKEYIQALIDMGLLEMNGDNLRASHQGRAVLNSVCNKLLGA